MGGKEIALLPSSSCPERCRGSKEAKSFFAALRGLHGQTIYSTYLVQYIGCQQTACNKMAFVSNIALTPLRPRLHRCGMHITSQAESTSSADGNDAGQADKESSACPGCKRPEGPVSGCDGEGRIIGGLGAFVQWWPIKAYRPCPDFLKTKKTYQRAGQSLDEIAFGRKGQRDDMSLSDRLGGK